MARGKKRSRGPENEEQLGDPTFCAPAAADDYFAGAQKRKGATDNSALLELASQHTAGYRDLLSTEVRL